MWTRFFPAVEQARRLALGDGTTGGGGVIGEVVQVVSDFNFNASDSDAYPTSFFYDRALGGGASYLVAPYPLAAATLFFRGAQPDAIKVVGQVDDERTGVDLQASMIMSFPPTGNVPPALDPNNTLENTAKLPGAGMAICSYGFLGDSRPLSYHGQTYTEGSWTRTNRGGNRLSLSLAGRFRASQGCRWICLSQQCGIHV